MRQRGRALCACHVKCQVTTDTAYARMHASAPLRCTATVSAVCLLSSDGVSSQLKMACKSSSSGLCAWFSRCTAAWCARPGSCFSSFLSLVASADSSSVLTRADNAAMLLTSVSAAAACSTPRRSSTESMINADGRTPAWTGQHLRLRRLTSSPETQRQEESDLRKNHKHNWRYPAGQLRFVGAFTTFPSLELLRSSKNLSPVTVLTRAGSRAEADALAAAIMYGYMHTYTHNHKHTQDAYIYSYS